ncbi:hypothetical protein JA1_002308 [Spathaspora sp. JA1]|nr:hypothetical protein JA1_002308 [Spathaspora sp. JA1]
MSKPIQVHILGAGAMGSLLTHDLSTQFPQTFQPTIFLKPGTANMDTKTIKLSRQIGPNWTTTNVTVNTIKPVDFLASITKYDKHGHIDNLIISTKAHQTTSAITPFIPYLSKSSNLLIVQNGMGRVNFLREKFWADSCPNIYEVVATHGAYIDEGIVRHASPGKLTIARHPSAQSTATPDIVNMILDTPSLNADLVDYNQFLIVQCEKLIVNCCINPLTALFDCFNGDLLHGGQELTLIFTRIIQEALSVLHKEYPLSSIPEASVFLNQARLLNHVLTIVKATRKNSSSMRQDVRMLRNTEVDNLNGYVGYLGRKHDVNTGLNRMIAELVKVKLNINKGVNQGVLDSILDVSSIN